MRLTPLPVLLLLAPALSAQASLWTVDDDGGADFTAIQDAVDAASDTDVIVVREGSYDSFAIVGRAVAVVAEQGEAPEIVGAIEVADLAPGQTVHLRGLSVPRVVFPVIVPTPHDALHVHDCAGSVWVEDCSLFGGAEAGVFPFGKGALVERADDVVFHRTTLRGREGEGLGAFDSDVALYDSDVEADGAGFLEGRAGALVVGGTLFAQGGSFRGAAGTDSQVVFDPFNMVNVCTTAQPGGPGLWLTRDPAPLPGGPAETAPEGRLRDVAVFSGAGGAGALDCPAAAAGVPARVEDGTLDVLRGIPRRLHVREAPVRVGETLHIDVTGPPGDLALLVYSAAAAGAEAPPFGPFHLGAPLFVLSLGIVPADGTLEFAAPAPDVGVQAFAIQAQALLGNASEVLLTPPSLIALLAAGL